MGHLYTADIITFVKKKKKKEVLKNYILGRASVVKS